MDCTNCGLDRLARKDSALIRAGDAFGDTAFRPVHPDTSLLAPRRQVSTQREEHGCGKGRHFVNESCNHPLTGGGVTRYAERVIQAPRKFPRALGKNGKHGTDVPRVDRLLEFRVPAFESGCRRPVGRLLAHDLESTRDVGKPRCVLVRMKELADPDPIGPMAQHVFHEPIGIHPIEQV